MRSPITIYSSPARKKKVEMIFEKNYYLIKSRFYKRKLYNNIEAQV